MYIYIMKKKLRTQEVKIVKLLVVYFHAAKMKIKLFYFTLKF